MLCSVKGQFPRFPGSAKYAVERAEKILCVNLRVQICVVLKLSGSYQFTKPNYMILISY